jgi:hypothetical protein
LDEDVRRIAGSALSSSTDDVSFEFRLVSYSFLFWQREEESASFADL